MQDRIYTEMAAYFRAAGHGVAHTDAVLAYAEEIMEGEGVPAEARERIAIAAILHDIGIPEAVRVHGSAAGPCQEAEGAVLARDLLARAGYPPADRERVVHIVGHHHTASALDGLDFRIVWDADLLVNLAEMPLRHDPDKLAKCLADTFQTPTGRRIARRVYGGSERMKATSEP